MVRAPGPPSPPALDSGPPRIQAEAHGAQHRWVLCFSLMLKLLAHPSCHEPLSLCYSASLKLHTADGPPACVLADTEEKSLRCWLDL